MGTQAASDLKHFIWVPHPRDDASLGVYFTVDRDGEEPTGYGRDHDPGCDPEISLTAFVNERGRNVGIEVADFEDVRTSVIERFDFAAAKRTERDQAAELTTLSGWL